MSNLIPPLLSSSPPPIVGPLDEDDDDEFGDFRAAADSYECDDFSLPSSPKKSPEKELKTDASKVNLDINSNKSQKVTNATDMPTQNLNGSIVNEEVNKDFQDRRKSLDTEEFKECESDVNSSNSQSVSSQNVSDDHGIINVTKTIDEQIVDEVVTETQSEICVDDSKIPNFDVEDDFTDLQSPVPSSKNCDEIQPDLGANDVVRVDSGGPSDLNSLSNEENIFDAFSESVQEKTSNSDDLSELYESNEIKSENDAIEEINCEITEDNKEYTFDNCSKDANYDNLSESSLNLRVETDVKLTDDEFGDFENHFNNEIEVENPPEASIDEFDDFVDPDPVANEDVEEQADDDFGDFESPEFGDFESPEFGDFESPEFGDFSAQACEKPAFLEIDEKNAVDKSETILKEVFPSIDSEISEFELADETKENVIFNALKDVTETNALIYQWSKSNSQKMFFKALNIDTRNILYGPAWNSSMPRFAANLGLAPLEPVRSEILTPTPVQSLSSPSNSSQKNNGDIPTAQFDWSGSGLINPLDSTSAEPAETVREGSSQPHPLTDFLPSPLEKPEPTPSLFDTEVLEKISSKPTTSSEKENIIGVTKTSAIQSDSFTPFQSPKLIPLRETHISTELNDLNNPGWLQPTIVTPDMPRKETVIDPEDDEFDDFQMVLPVENETKTIVAEVKSDAVTLPDLSDFDQTSKVPSVDKPSHNHEHILGISINSGPINSLDQKQKQTIDDDDEFTEFHSSLPQTEVFKPLQPVPLELLTPTIQYATPIAQINWPDPGVSDEDIKNIELTYSRKSESKEEIKVKEPSKESSVDDDEWSDFVSVTNSIKSVMPERTSTPDLPLSVLNLNHVQAPKQPIPVITPSGLVQTKLSSNLTKSVVQTSVQPNLFRPPMMQYQPSIISSQYAANFPSSATAAPSKSQSQDDDDDWSDFVSSQPPPHVNGYQQKSSFNQKAPPINWTNATTNIIMNPTHFEAFPTYGPPQNKKVPAMPARNVIPSISAIPDLDFIAPKNRTSKK